MTSSSQSTLDCQDCGNTVRKLTDAEAQEVAAAPYNFIVYCTSCKADRSKGLYGNAW
jgi:uncharacterized protein with PIN domain